MNAQEYGCLSLLMSIFYCSFTNDYYVHIIGTYLKTLKSPSKVSE